MTRLWSTGVAKSAVLGGVPLAKKSKSKRKTRSAVQIRAEKQKRAALRAAAADTCSGEDAASAGHAEGASVEHEASGTTFNARGLSDGHVAALAPCDVTKPGESSHSLSSNHTESSGANEVATAEWTCIICTHTNPGESSRCASCNLDRPEVIYDSVPGDTGTEGDSVDQSLAAGKAATVTDETVAVIGHKTVRDPTAPDQMYYPIYGEYYTGRDVTVTRKFATTVEDWAVAYINDRRQTPLGTMYRVLWIHPDRSCKSLYLRTWEPAVMLRQDGFVDEMQLVDRWKASTIPLFEDFWRNDKIGFGLLGADDDGLCVFNALRRAAELAGRPDIVTQQDIDQFIKDVLVLYSRDLREGATWTDVRDFLVRLRDAGRDIAYNAFVKNNYSTSGRRGARVLEEIKVPDGIYIVGAYNHSHIGHGAVLTVNGRQRLIYDLKQGKPISSARDWINFYAFVRPFIVFK